MELRRGTVMNFSRLHLGAILGLATGAWAVVLLCQGTDLTLDHLRPFGTVLGVLGLGVWALEKFLWHQSWLQGWFVKRPDLRGTWEVERRSDWIDPDKGEPEPMKICYMGVVQTQSTLQMHLMTDESESWLIADRITPSPSGQGYQVAAVYTNKPNIHLRGMGNSQEGRRSEIHLGALLVDTHGSPARPESLTGEYWTDRKTKGTLHFTSRTDELVTSYDDAKQMFDR